MHPVKLKEIFVPHINIYDGIRGMTFVCGRYQAFSTTALGVRRGDSRFPVKTSHTLLVALHGNYYTKNTKVQDHCMKHVSASTMCVVT